MVVISKFPSIGQYRQVVKEIQLRSAYVGQDELDSPIYDSTIPKPTLRFKGFVKLHGTNAGVGHNPTYGMWAQSRTNVITPKKDNAGFAFFVESKKVIFEKMIQSIRDENKDIIGIDDDVIIFGEWAGKGIQKGVAINSIERAFFIFDVKVRPKTEETSYYITSDYLKYPEHRIYNIADFPNFTIDIDFNRPELSQTELTNITQRVEDSCPVGASFGEQGVGEGVVWSATYKGTKLRFKVKGDKHAGISKVKVLKPVDDERINRLYDIATQVTPQWRLQQMLSEACDFINGGNLDRKYLGDFIKLVINDVMKEELDTLVESNIEPKEINSYISKICREYFFNEEKAF